METVVFNHYRRTKRCPHIERIPAELLEYFPTKEPLSEIPLTEKL